VVVHLTLAAALLLLNTTPVSIEYMFGWGLEVVWTLWWGKKSLVSTAVICLCTVRYGRSLYL